jgi:hypothetical protein
MPNHTNNLANFLFFKIGFKRMNTIYIYLAARDGAPLRDRRRKEYVNRDWEILALQSNLQNGRITIRAFLMAAAYHFNPVEFEFGDQDIEVMNRHLNEVRAAFEALLENPVAVPVAAEAPVPVAARSGRPSRSRSGYTSRRGCSRRGQPSSSCRC